MDLAAIRALVLAWPGVTEDVKWGADHVFSVDGKMFCVLGGDAAGVDGLSFKVADDDFLPMTGTPGIAPAPYLARARWVQLQPGHRMPARAVAAHLRRSYELIRAKLSKKRQRELAD